MNLFRAPSKRVLALAGALALAGGVAAGGAFGASPTTATIDAVDYGFVAQGGAGGNATTIALGGTVDFRYPTGADEHNVRFTRDGVSCTQTDGVGGATNSKVVPTTPEEQGWAGRCSFTQAGTYSFICDIPEHDMKGSVVVVDERPPATDPGTGTTTPTTPSGPGTPTPTAPSATTPTTVSTAPAASVPLAPVIKVTRTQKGTTVRGTITKAGDRSKVAVDVRATRGSVKAPGRRTSLVSVGKATTRSSSAGRLSFAIRLDAKARAALQRGRKLALDVKVSITLPVIGVQAETFRVSVTPAAATARAAAKAPAKAAVTLKNVTFAPASVTIRKGATVTWTWHDGDVPHDVVGSGFRSAVVTRGSFKHRFAKAGTFRYVCSIHAKMRGKVVVR
ncbi:MAG: blue (type 1) copper domain protein [Conexibacter sp.]|nr:blue (type 1) copper domain protein [Conexibacter sp.]